MPSAAEIFPNSNKNEMEVLGETLGRNPPFKPLAFTYSVSARWLDGAEKGLIVSSSSGATWAGRCLVSAFAMRSVLAWLGITDPNLHISSLDQPARLHLLFIEECAAGRSGKASVRLNFSLSWLARGGRHFFIGHAILVSILGNPLMGLSLSQSYYT
jgi:hypothetical protein